MAEPDVTEGGKVLPLTRTEAGAVGRLARRIWTACYAGMIPSGQIDYMLERMYSRSVIQAELDRGVIWEWWECRGARVGFMAWEGPDSGGWLRLHKLYLDPMWHGRGHGQAMLRHVSEEGRERGARGIELRVNKANHRALRAYRRAGYQVVEDVCEEIGGGFVMDDHRLRLNLVDPTGGG